MKTRQNTILNYSFMLCALLTYAFLSGGCATFKGPALDADTRTIDVSNESIALFTVKIANNYKPTFQPNINQVVVWNVFHDNPERFAFLVDDKFIEVKNSFNEYLISFQLPPGEYKLATLLAPAGFFPLPGTFSVPIYSTFTLPPNAIIYLGHIDATVIEKTNDDQLRAGPVLPLIDQALIGASGGTFLITISDLFENDLRLFQRRYPYLAGQPIINMTLPQWKQPTEAEMD